ncbi:MULTISPECIES: acyl carrier protein [unclassified Streptomyces]|jgi:acyl carrier protein|uniref:acyl carrier protein n=1 Tax=unclassified Streptomyces TaxID=2593676 RepID=UPI000A1F4207|nr:acyl carrier protein [Streptomyces sp. 13-12-16]OSP43216.1 phosphopantetheine-binding protein [Streptomyces sp. 13-12-16]WCL22576.1 acyl carrier protein [Streptomyces sp.]
MWDDSFEEILRKNLPLLESGDEITADLSLRDHGLDSMGMVAILSSLESTYGVRFVDDALDLDNFATPETLWKTLSAMR